MFGVCDWSCMASYFLSLTGREMLALYVALPMTLTFCHEGGHYCAARLCGIDSKEFALGKGPAFLRVRVIAGCTLALRMFPFGGRVTYDDRYWDLNYASRAFLSAAGWLADVALAVIVVSVVHLLGAAGPVATFLCWLVGIRVACNLLPVTDDGRKTIRYLWLAATDRKVRARRT